MTIFSESFVVGLVYASLGLTGVAIVSLLAMIVRDAFKGEIW